MALLEDDHLVELMYDRPDQGRLVGDIFLGKVEAVLPGIQAAFVNIGTEKAGFLHASDLDYEDDDDDENGDNGGRRKSRKEVPIQDVIRQGQEVLVQVTKEPIGTKGPRLTTQISMPGRFLVFMPGSSHVGVSRKIEDRGERSRLRKLAKEIVPSGSGGVIVRTVGEELNRNTFEKEFKRLTRSGREIQKKAKTAEAPALVHGEAKLISGVIRDLFSDKFDSLTVDNPEIHAEITRYSEARRSGSPGPASPLFRSPAPLRQARYRGGDLSGLPEEGDSALRGLHHHRAHRGPGVHRREHGPVHREEEEGPGAHHPEDQPRCCPGDRETASAPGRRGDRGLRFHRHGIPKEPGSGAP